MHEIFSPNVIWSLSRGKALHLKCLSVNAKHIIYTEKHSSFSPKNFAVHCSSVHLIAVIKCARIYNSKVERKPVQFMCWLFLCPHGGEPCPVNPNDRAVIPAVRTLQKNNTVQSTSPSTPTDHPPQSVDTAVSGRE